MPHHRHSQLGSRILAFPYYSSKERSITAIPRSAEMRPANFECFGLSFLVRAPVHRKYLLPGGVLVFGEIVCLMLRTTDSQRRVPLRGHHAHTHRTGYDLPYYCSTAVVYTWYEYTCSTIIADHLLTVDCILAVVGAATTVQQEPCRTDPTP